MASRGNLGPLKNGYKKIKQEKYGPERDARIEKDRAQMEAWLKENEVTRLPSGYPQGYHDEEQPIKVTVCIDGRVVARRHA